MNIAQYRTYRSRRQCRKCIQTSPNALKVRSSTSNQLHHLVEGEGNPVRVVHVLGLRINIPIHCLTNLSTSGVFIFSPTWSFHQHDDPDRQPTSNNLLYSTCTVRIATEYYRVQSLQSCPGCYYILCRDSKFWIKHQQAASQLLHHRGCSIGGVTALPFGKSPIRYPHTELLLTTTTTSATCVVPDRNTLSRKLLFSQDKRYQLAKMGAMRQRVYRQRVYHKVCQSYTAEFQLSEMHWLLAHEKHELRLAECLQ